MGYRVLAETTMLAHFGYLVYVALGGFLAWRWPRSGWLHVAATGWGFSTILIGLDCPLTDIENWARERAGRPQLSPGGFIDHYLEGVVYPERYTGLIRVLVLLSILTSWAGIYLQWRARRRAVRRRIAAGSTAVSRR